MNELKFRAYDTKLKQWVAEGFHIFGEVTLFNMIGHYCLETKGDGDSLERYNDIVVTQWTGLKDKNRKDIYEGDIIRSFFKDGKECLHLIEWMPESACFVAMFLSNSPIPDTPCSVSQSWISEYSKEVIGNIFSNPELLNK